MKAILSLVVLIFSGAAAKAEMPLPQMPMMAPQMAQPMPMPMPMPMARPVTVVTQTTSAIPRACGGYGCGQVLPPPMPPCGGQMHGGCGGGYPGYGQGYPYYPRYAQGGCRRGCRRARRRCGRGCGGAYGRRAYKSSGWYVNLPFASFGGFSNKAVY